MFQSSINLASSTAEFGTQIGVLSARKFENGNAECENDNSRNDGVKKSTFDEIYRKMKDKLKSDINKNNFM